MSILERFTDALVMFWQSLDSREQRMIMVGVVYLVATVAFSQLEGHRKEQEKAELVEAVARRLAHGAA